MNKDFQKKIAFFFLSLSVVIALYYLRIDVLDQKGPFWLGYNSDPSYGYLMNSLNMAFYNGGLGYQSLHPGMPMYILGAIVIIVQYLIRYVSIGFDYTLVEGMQMDVLNNPELYITSINAAFSILNIFLLLLVTWLVFKQTKSLLYASILLFLPFYSEIFVQDVIGNLSAEPALFTVNFLFLAYVLLSGFKKWDQKKVTLALNQKKLTISYNALFMGILCGVGLSAKFPFLVFWLIPIILIYNIRENIKFMVVAVSTFILSISPIIFRFFFTLKFWVEISNRSAGYGHNFGLGFAIKSILLSNPAIFISLLIFSGLLLVILKQNDFKFKKLLQNYSFRITLALYLSYIIQIVIVSRHYMGSRYFLSLICLLPFLLISQLAFQKITYSEHKSRPILNGLVYLIPFLFLANGYYNWDKMRTELSENQASGLKIHEFLAEHKDQYIQVFTYRVSNQLYALRFGDEYARQLNQEKLKEIYGDFFHYNSTFKKYYNWDKEVEPSKIMAQNKDILLFGTEPSEIIEQQFQKKVSVFKEFEKLKIYVLQKD